VVISGTSTGNNQESGFVQNEKNKGLETSLEIKIMGKILFKLTEIVERVVEKQMKRMYIDIASLLTEVITSNIGSESKKEQNLRIVSMVRNSMGDEVSQPILDAMHNREISAKDNTHRAAERDRNFEREQQVIHDISDQEEEILENENKRKQMKTTTQSSPSIGTRSKAPTPAKAKVNKTTVIRKPKGVSKTSR
jgi:hypothetical protein